MARYIDAEKCPCNGCGITYCNENCKKYYAWLDGCDYDLEAKVVELEKQKNRAMRVYERTCVTGGYEHDYADGESDAYEEAISIVRGKE